MRYALSILALTATALLVVYVPQWAAAVAVPGAVLQTTRLRRAKRRRDSLRKRLGEALTDIVEERKDWKERLDEEQRHHDGEVVVLKERFVVSDQMRRESDRAKCNLLWVGLTGDFGYGQRDAGRN